MRCVEVRAGRPYEVFIGRGLMDAAGGMIVEALGGTRMAAILTDDTVDALYGARVEQALSESGLRTCRFAMPHGEAHKTLATWEKMLAFLSEQGMTRADAVVALGGGVPGDVAGFAAACYQRGVDLVQIPTTLLAMIDSSVGGKTGVDLGGLKNQVGAFHQPRLVLIDPDALSTLPAATLSDGAAEAVKYGVLGDTELFERLSRGGWTEDAEWVIERCVFHKAALVAADELDRGSRQLLNLGHTLGHAIEKCSGFRFSHGQAVAVGMIYAARIARSMGLCGPEVEADIAAALTAGGLPLSAPYGAAELAAAAMADKKRAGGEITLVLPRAIGRCELRRVPAAELEELARVAVGGGGPAGQAKWRSAGTRGCGAGSDARVVVGDEAPKAKPNGGALARAGAAEPEAMHAWRLGAEAPKAESRNAGACGGCGAGSDARGGGGLRPLTINQTKEGRLRWRFRRSGNGSTRRTSSWCRRLPSACARRATSPTTSASTACPYGTRRASAR